MHHRRQTPPVAPQNVLVVGEGRVADAIARVLATRGLACSRSPADQPHRAIRELRPAAVVLVASHGWRPHPEIADALGDTATIVCGGHELKAEPPFSEWTGWPWVDPVLDGGVAAVAMRVIVELGRS